MKMDKILNSPVIETERFILRPIAKHNIIKPATETCAGLIFAVFLFQIFTQHSIVLFGWAL